jgi:hypothetical protein
MDEVFGTHRGCGGLRSIISETGLPYLCSINASSMCAGVTALAVGARLVMTSRSEVSRLHSACNDRAWLRANEFAPLMTLEWEAF